MMLGIAAEFMEVKAVFFVSSAFYYSLVLRL